MPEEFNVWATACAVGAGALLTLILVLVVVYSANNSSRATEALNDIEMGATHPCDDQGLV
jgi:hypothetical protein